MVATTITTVSGVTQMVILMKVDRKMTELYKHQQYRVTLTDGDFCSLFIIYNKGVESRP